MARTPLLSLIRRLAYEHRSALAARMPVAELRQARAERALARGPSRRQFLLGATAAAALAAKKDESSGPPVESGPRIAIVGGGIAGLCAALTLRDKGVACTVYDISQHRVGGRMVSERGAEPTGCNNCHVAPATAPKMSWSDGQVSDVYGELIDSGHTTIQALAARFGLALTDALAAEPSGSTETWYFQGGYYAHSAADTDFGALYDALQQDASDAGWPVTYDTVNQAARTLDNMSIYDWIEARVPGGHTSALGLLLDDAYRMEFGADSDDQSALNLLSLLSDSEASPLSVLGASDERYRLAGGVDQLPRAIGDFLGIGSTVALGHDFQALRMESDGTYTLTFATPGGTVEVRADYVVLALPFATLRTRTFAQAGFDALKEHAIRELGAGRNAKLQLQFTSRLWNTAGPWGVSNGTSYSDTGYQLSWDTTRGQTGASGILVGYNGGSAVTSMQLTHPYGNAGVPALVADAQAFLTQIEPVFPGLSAAWNGKAVGAMPHLDPRFNGSYAYYRVGQVQLLCGYERVPQGNVYFCGEHTSIENQGYMEGAASEGIATGQALLSALGIPVA